MAGFFQKTVCCYGRKGVGNKVVLKERGMEYSFNHIFSLKLSNFFAINLGPQVIDKLFKELIFLLPKLLRLG